jgi:hypothetical protein
MEVPNGTIKALAVPPLQFSDLGEFGETCCAAYGFAGISAGPNTGFLYVSTFTPGTTASYQINSDLENQNSTFSQHQCGNYSAANPGGFISWNNLLTQTQRHEYNSTTQSHWAFYSNSLNANNPGDQFEGQVATPGTSLAAFGQALQSTINSDTQQIAAATAVEPYGANDDQNGNFLGNVNFGPNYVSCN